MTTEEASQRGMPLYQYRGVDEAGRRRRGVVEADAEEEALRRLNEEGVLPLELRRSRVGELEQVLRRLGGTPIGRLPLRDAAWFCRQFATMLRAGLPVARILGLLEGGERGGQLRRLAAEARQRVEGGQSLTAAFSPWAARLPTGFLALVRAGEASGTLDEVFLRLAELYERSYEQQQKVRSAAFYPTVVAVVALGLVIFMLAFVVPNFATLYGSLHAQLPSFSEALFRLSAWLGGHLAYVGGAVGLVLLLFAYALAVPRARRLLALGVLRLPVLGKIQEAAILARLAFTLSTLLRSGVPVLESLALAGEVAGDTPYGKAFQAAAKRVEQGEALAASLGDAGRFPPLFLEMLRIGEESGSVDEMLARVGAFYDQEVEGQTRQLTSLLEPLLVMSLGAVVAVVVSAILIPMYDVFRLIGTGGGL